ncbi:hypothetical protein [Flavobacterium macacae]|uniref:Uncharacterized protein n=1 Tax=Flavobacterium macacae TaxID=2488993 RepID=A0A3P3VYI5_9FLAO|nr:hypothetical protein [Flavobacterium macacae]RRJ87118.1 hypothetical protein EG849_15435 [Flavobacterium macacae]
MNYKMQIKYWGLVFLISLISTYVVHLLIKPIWGTNIDNNTLATTIESLTTILILPLYLSIVNVLIAKNYNVKYQFFIINVVLVLFCVWLSAYLHFENWANSIGDKLNPDNATLEVMGLTKLAGYIVSTVALSTAFFYLRRFQKKTN